jgi:hypothetical protein
MILLLQMHDMAFKLTAFPRLALRSGRVVSPAAALAAEDAALHNGVRGSRLWRLYLAAERAERAERALNRAQRVVDEAARRS